MGFFCLLVSKSAYRCKQYIESQSHGGYTVATFTVGVNRAFNRQINVVGGIFVACLYFWWLSVFIKASPSRQCTYVRQDLLIGCANPWD
jgi:hypothetical protein